MALPTTLRRRGATPLRAVAVLFALLLGMTIQASPAAADESICGHNVGGAILAKYAELGRTASPLKCPVTEELTNPDGVGKRQQFEGGTIYWHPTLSDGAHPIWGKIGDLWGQYGWESGKFGYPTSDELLDEAYKSKYQTFSKNRLTIFWSAGNGDHGCAGQCVGYEGSTGTDWFKRTRVEIPIGGDHDGKPTVRTYPTEDGFMNARTDFTAAWNQMWSLAPYPNGLSDTQHNSVYEQFACHAKYADKYLLPGGWNTGLSWDFESYRSDVGMLYATSLPTFLIHKCEW